MRKTLLTLSLLLALPALHAAAQSFPCSTSGGTNCYAIVPDGGGLGSYWNPTADAPGVLTSTIDVPAATCSGSPFSRAQITVDMVHDWLGDVRVRVISPNATAATLLDRPSDGFPGGTRAADVRATFGDGFSGGLVAGLIPAMSGNVAPQTPLSAVLGQAPGGTWTLEITDFSNFGTGALNDWSVFVYCAPIPDVSIVATDPTASENPVFTGTFAVTRAIVWDQPLSVDVVISGTAGAGDYQPITVPVVIPANQASATVTVTPIYDTLVEGAETVVATLQPSIWYTLGAPTSATVTIVDIDPSSPVPTLSTVGLAALALLLGLLGALLLRSRMG
jgi:subtilisin-like proprotein convertase family protein